MRIKLTEPWSDYVPGNILDLPDALAERLCEKRLALRLADTPAATMAIETAEAPATETAALVTERTKPGRRGRRHTE